MENIFKDRLKDARVRAGYSQLNLAIEIKTTQKHVWDWEKGIKEPRLNNIIMLCRVLNVSADYLLGLD